MEQPKRPGRQSMNKLLIGVISLLLLNVAAGAEEVWQTLPKPPAMPTPVDSGMAPVNDIQMYYAVYGEGEPVLLIHGGLGLPGAGIGREPQGDRRRQPGPRPQHTFRKALRLCADGRRLPGPARSPWDRQGGAGRVERWRHHRARHRNPPSRAAGPAVRVRRQLHASGSEAERRERSDLQCVYRARRRGLRPPLAHARRVRRVRRADLADVGTRTTARTGCARSPCRR
jgi:hypothetical protein